MKRRCSLMLLTVVIFTVLTTPALARPTHSVEQWHYDEYGNQVGYRYQSCYGGFPYQEGQLTDRYNQFMEACPWTLQDWISCPDVGLHGTGCADYCVTSGFYMSVAVSQTFADPFGCIYP